MNSKKKLGYVVNKKNLPGVFGEKNRCLYTEVLFVTLFLPVYLHVLAILGA